jgi:hypothetical protein
MEKIQFNWREIKLTHQTNDTKTLALIAVNDKNASVLINYLSVSKNIGLRYIIDNTNGYFDLFVDFNDMGKFVNLTLNINDEMKELAHCIDKQLISYLWTGYYQDNVLIPIGNPYAVIY